jgi:hypothetical protein
MAVCPEARGAPAGANVRGDQMAMLVAELGISLRSSPKRVVGHKSAQGGAAGSAVADPVRDRLRLLTRAGPRSARAGMTAPLVSRFRSSHHGAAHSFANFGIKGTLAIYDSKTVPVRVGSARPHSPASPAGLTWLDPRVHPLRKSVLQRRWITGSSPAMTEERPCQHLASIRTGPALGHQVNRA